MLISIIIPCYNAEKFVERAIESVFCQTYKNWELILVDNNSTDNTLAILNKYKDLDNNKIKVLSQLKKGAPAARNKGLQVSKGSWIQFLDADDKLSKNKLMRQALLAKDTNATIIVNKYARVINWKNISLNLTRKVYSKSQNHWEALISSRLGITSANLWKRETLIRIGGWDESLTSAQEYNLIFKLLKEKSKVITDNSFISAFIYYEQNSITRINDANRNILILENHLALILNVKEYLVENNMLNEYTSRLIDQTIYYIIMSRKKFIPEYTSKRIKDFNLKISISYKLKQNLKILTKSLFV